MRARRLTAIQECFMNGNPEDPRLTIGKSYTIFKITIRPDAESNGHICIVNDESRGHTFGLVRIHEFFTTK